MKMGDKLICVRPNSPDGLWTSLSGKKNPGPKFNEEVTYHETYTCRNKQFYRFFEYGVQGYASRFFEPIITDKELYTELETIKETITN